MSRLRRYPSYFGESQIEAIAAKHNIPVVCKLPIDPAIAAKCDRGAAEEYEGEWLDPMVEFLKKEDNKTGERIK